MAIAWRRDPDEALAEAKLRGRHVLFDFSAAPMSHTAEALTRQYPDSVWAKKASVWLKPEVSRDARV